MRPNIQRPLWVKSCPDSPKDRLPLYTRKRTQLGHLAMSEKCHVWPGRGPADCHSGNCPTETVDPPGDVLWSAHGEQITTRLETRDAGPSSRRKRAALVECHADPLFPAPYDVAAQPSGTKLAAPATRRLATVATEGARPAFPTSLHRRLGWGRSRCGGGNAKSRTNPAKINRGHPSVTPSNLGL